MFSPASQAVLDHWGPLKTRIQYLRHSLTLERTHPKGGGSLHGLDGLVPNVDMNVACN